MPAKGHRVTGRHARGLLRPHCWITGLDPKKHDMYHPWQMSKAQANFRQEEWDLTFEEYYNLWEPHWENRGRRTQDMCMTRKDVEKAWTKKNVHVITRMEHFKTAGGKKSPDGYPNTNSKKAKK